LIHGTLGNANCIKFIAKYMYNDICTYVCISRDTVVSRLRYEQDSIYMYVYIYIYISLQV